MEERGVDTSQRSYARFAGLMYVVVLLLDIAGGLITSGVGGTGTFGDVSHRIIASETLYRVGLGLALAGTLSTIPLAVALYATLKPVDRNLTMMALLFRLAESAVGAMGIVMAFSVLQIQLAVNHGNAFETNQLDALANFSSGPSTDVSAIFFCAGSAIFFYVFLKSGYIPRILSAWGVFASLVYAVVWITDLVVPNHPGLVTILGSLPILIAEVATALWLLIAGIRNPARLGTPVVAAVAL